MSLRQYLLRLFQPARSTSVGKCLWKAFLQSIVFWAVFLGILPGIIVGLEQALDVPGFAFPGQRIVGIVLFTLGSLLGPGSSAYMAKVGRGTPLPTECPRRLVIVGPYAFVRNPMAIAGLGQAAGIAVWCGSYGILTYVLAGGLLWNFVIRPVEEIDLKQRFGDDYERYRDAVRCWIPRLRPYRQ